MAATVKYWRLPDEEVDFVRYLESIEPTMAFAYRTYPTEAEIQWQPVGSVSPMTEVHLITPARFVADCRMFWRDAREPAGFTIDHTSSPVLYYRPGRSLESNMLESTALSAEWTYLDDGSCRDFPADFVRWGKRVMQWVRRVAPGWYGHKTNRITPRVEEARQQGLELVG
jgi:hypothetical protein